MLGRQTNVEVDVADRLAAARSHELEATAIACAALLARLHLQNVALVDGVATAARCLALANVANGVHLLTQRRRLGDARVQLAIDDGDALVIRLRVEEMVARVIAAAREEEKIAVVGIL